MTADPPGEPPAGPDQHADPDQLTDPELIAAVRAGDPDPFGTLYRRHVDAARRLAVALARHPADADDLVAEAFANLLGTLREGGGPDVAFRAYLLTTVRNLFYDRARRDRRLNVTDDLSRHDAGVPFEDTAVEGLERTLVARAFARLPERWQTVLWHTQVEGETPAAVAPILGLTPNGVAALAYRARERLRQNYLREHVTTSPTDECQSTVDRLGGYVRSGLSQRDRAAVDHHLSACRRCQVLFLELGDVNTSLRTLLAPVVLGEAAAVAYLGASTAGGFTGFLSPIWSGTKQVARRRSTQAGAGAAVVAAAVALALVLTSSPGPEPELEAPPGPGDAPGAAAPPAPPGAEPPPDEPAPEAPPGAPGADPAAAGASPAATPPAAAEPVALEVSLEPVGALVRDRPGVLALTVTVLDSVGGVGGGVGGGTTGPAAGGVGGSLDRGEPAAPLAAGQPAGEPPETGPLTAMLTVPDGVSLRAGEPGDRWACTRAGGGIRCRRGSLAAGTTSLAYVPVDVSAGAGGGAPRVRLTAPGIEAASATAPRGVQSDGFGARFAGLRPATVRAGGNALLSCLRLDLTCRAARAGRSALGRVDNDDYLMTRYRDPDAPAGAPKGAAVSGATIRVPGRVVWAGLYWSGSGSPPGSPVAHLHTPGRAGFAPVAATTVRRVGDAALRRPAYQASAEVTDLIRGTSGGDWWVAVDADAFGRGFGAYGGWALLIVAEDGGPDRSVAVFDELTPLRDQQSFAAAVFGNPGDARIAFVGWEGDRGLTGDRLRLDGERLGGADRGNVAGSRTDGIPAGRNTLGTDARVLDAVFPSGDRPTLAARTGRDSWLLGPVAVVTPPP